VKVARHLVNDLGVQAIIGVAYSGITISFATAVTVPAGVLAISPAATSVLITSLDDKGLVWRTSPSDRFQGRAAALLVSCPALRETRIPSKRDTARLFPSRGGVVDSGEAVGHRSRFGLPVTANSVASWSRRSRPAG
jgi:hypothetical protein